MIKKFSLISCIILTTYMHLSSLDLIIEKKKKKNLLACLKMEICLEIYIETNDIQ